MHLFKVWKPTFHVTVFDTNFSLQRNYAEWRASHEGTFDDQLNGNEQVLEGFPIEVIGHKYNVECIVSDGNFLASCDLTGESVLKSIFR